MSTLLGQVTWSAGFKLSVYYDVLSRDDVANTTTVSFDLMFTSGAVHGVHLSNLACKRRVGDTVYGGFVSIDQPASSTRSIDTWESTINNGVSTLVRVYLPLNAYFNGTYYESVTTADAYVQFDINPYTVFGTVNNGTLDTTHTINVVKHTPGATHTIIYQQGTESGTICTNSSDTTINWIPPLSLAKLSPGGTSVAISLLIRTFLDGSGSGGTTGYTGYLANITLSIPASVTPTAAIAVSDGNGYAATYVKYLHNKSTYAVNITATPAYGSAIVSYSTVVSGKTVEGNTFSATYSGSSFTTDILNLVGNVSILTTVTDARGRTGTALKQVTAVQYTPPLITALSTHRCNVNGTENDQGEYISFTFSATVQSLSNINTATYWYKYKSSVAGSYTSVALPSLANQYAVTNYTVIIPADSSYTYDIIVSVKDGVMTTEQSVQASTAATILNLHNSGTGIGIGKVAEAGNLLDVGWPARFRGSVLFDGSIYSGGVVGTVTRTAGSMGHNATIIGQCFCTCLGNGKFRFDVSGKWTVSSSTVAHNYGIAKDFLRRAVYNNIYSNTGNLANLNFVYEGDCIVFSASDFTLGHPNIDYGWAVQGQPSSFCLARLYNTAANTGGWEDSVVKSTFPSGFYFTATIFAGLT